MYNNTCIQQWNKCKCLQYKIGESQSYISNINTRIHISKPTANVTEWLKYYICDIGRVTQPEEKSHCMKSSSSRLVTFWTDQYTSVLLCCIVKRKFYLWYLTAITSFCKNEKYRGLGNNQMSSRRCPYNPENNRPMFTELPTELLVLSPKSFVNLHLPFLLRQLYVTQPCMLLRAVHTALAFFLVIPSSN